MKTRFILLILLSFCSFINNLPAQYISNKVGYFKTYEDYLNNNLQIMDELRGHELAQPFTAHEKLVFILDGKKVKIDRKDIWGLQISTHHIYRVNHGDGIIYQIVGFGKVILYYVDHYSWGDMQGHTSSTNPYYAFSNDLNSEIEDFTKSPGSNKSNEVSEKIRSKYPQYTKLFDCIDGNLKTLPEVKECVDTFNAQ